MRSFHFQKFNGLLFLIYFLFALQIKVTFAQGTNKINPLNNSFTHELLPNINRDLTILEKDRIKAEIEALDSQAEQKLSGGETEEAFSLWYEAINLSRFIDLNLEINLITKLSKVAWDAKRSQDLGFLQARLAILEQENSQKGKIKPEFLGLFIQAYDNLHSLDKLIELNQYQLSLAKEAKKEELINQTLARLGELHLAKFDYAQAQPIYQQLLENAKQEQNYLSQSIYLQKLAEISQALVNPQNSVQYKEDLVNNYQQNNNLFAVARLKISIGDDYKALDNPELASKAYQDAFKLALSLEQYAIAGDALKKLGLLYQQYQELDSALKIYQELIKIERNSYNYYGLMNTYDFIGTIYSQKQDYSQALNSFQKALAIARQLKYKEDYFLQKIAQLESLDN
jgi:tetratricopeptide (TPR) repeat protein